MINIQTLKGFRDFLPQEARKRQFVINTLKKVFESYGFEPLETPALEYEDILLGKYGEEGDKLMYRFIDNGGRNVALRYDQTVPLARVAAQYANTLPLPFKRYQIQPVWRAENTQKGRFREFLQCDIDTVGIESPYSDAEIISLAINSLKALGFTSFKALINDRNIFSKLIEKTAVVKEELPKVIRIIDKLKKIGREGVIDELVKNGFPDERATYILQTIESYPPTKNLEVIFESLEELGITSTYYEFSPTLARGMNYYTGTIFEIEIEGYSAGSVVGGGRFDNLIGMFADKNMPAVGCAFGFDRIIDAMDDLNLFPQGLTTARVLVTIFSKDLMPESLMIASKLRSNNINTEIWLDTETGIDKQLKYADKKNIPFSIIIGPEEKTSSMVVLKDLTNRTQEVLTLDETIQKLTQ